MKFVPNAISSRVALTALKANKHSPTLMFSAGVVGVVATAVLSSRATLKVSDILDETQEQNEQISNGVGRPLSDGTTYTPEDLVKDKALLRVQTIVKIGKLYILPVAVGTVSIALLVGSHKILSGRNAALTAAYATLDKGFREYRKRVTDDLGEDTDRKYSYGVENQTITKTDSEGKKTQVVQKVATGLSPYGKLFHEGNPNWNRTPEYNLVFLRAQNNYVNDLLQTRGFVLLNDVYDALGFDRTKAGMVVGWLRNGDGDGFVDFGIWDDDRMIDVHDFVTGREGELFLNFNVDGNIFEKI